MNRRYYAVILAGGQGLRMGYDIPKQFIEIEENRFSDTQSSASWRALMTSISSWYCLPEKRSTGRNIAIVPVFKALYHALRWHNKVSFRSECS